MVLSAAINKAGSTDPAKIREAILALKKFPGAEGEYNFDANGDGLHGYNVVRNEKGTIVLRQAHRLQRLIASAGRSDAEAAGAQF
jgi:ABC-type branched-subunit amino acid transport system substrate-binding protein